MKMTHLRIIMRNFLETKLFLFARQLQGQRWGSLHFSKAFTSIFRILERKSWCRVSRPGKPLGTRLHSSRSCKLSWSESRRIGVEETLIWKVLSLLTSLLSEIVLLRKRVGKAYLPRLAIFRKKVTFIWDC